MNCPAAVVAVMLKKSGMRSVMTVSLKKLPDEVKGLRSLPKPAFVLREIRIRTQNELEWRRFYVLPETTAEIDFNSAENYRNTHFREKDREIVYYRLDIPPSLLTDKLVKKRDEIR